MNATVSLELRSVNRTTQRRPVIDSPSRPNLTPQLGRVSISILVLFAIGWFVAWRQFHAAMPETGPVADVRIYCLIGICYGIAAGSCWLASAIHNRYVRFILRASLVVAFAFVKHTLNDRGMIRNGLDLAGVCYFQLLLLFLMNVPRWEVGRRLGNQDRANQAAGRRQFAIADIVLMTGAFAAILGLAIRFTPPIDAETYWMVLAIAWIVIPAVGASLARSLFSRTRASTIGSAMAAIVFAVLLVYIASAAEARAVTGASGKTSFELYVPFYGGLLGGFFAAFAVIAVAGRVQPIEPMRAPTAVARH